jgi:hypothetical protein
VKAVMNTIMATFMFLNRRLIYRITERQLRPCFMELVHADCNYGTS